jgi:hypothetical protein
MAPPRLGRDDLCPCNNLSQRPIHSRAPAHVHRTRGFRELPRADWPVLICYGYGQDDRNRLQDLASGLTCELQISDSGSHSCSPKQAIMVGRRTDRDEQLRSQKTGNL